MISATFNRFSASAIHFGISFIIFSIFLFALLTLWFPEPFFRASGGWQGLKIVALVGIVLGPLLTLIVFNNKKSSLELRIDISLIVFIQCLALGWGMYTVYNQRPVAAVFWEGKFYTVPAMALEQQGISITEIEKYSDKLPAFIFIDRPDSAEEWEPVLEKMGKLDIPPHHQISLYRPASRHMQEIYRYNLDIDEIISENDGMQEQIQQILQKNNTTLEKNHYIGLESKYHNIILVYDDTDRIIGTANTPHKEEK